MRMKIFLIYKLIVIFLLAVIVIIIPGWALAFDRASLKPEYIGTSLHYGSEAKTIFKDSDYVDYDNRQIRFFTGKYITDPWRMEFEFIVASIREDSDWFKKNETLFGFQAGILYDFLQFNNIKYYAGFSAGLSYINHPSGYLDLAAENPFGQLEARLGIEYKFNKKIFLRVQTGVWHISSVFNQDKGHNCWDYSIYLGYFF